MQNKSRFVLHFSRFALSLHTKPNICSMMTAVQLNAEIYRAMGVIAEDETLLARAAKYLKKLAAKKEDPTLMTHTELVERIEEAEREYREGKTLSFASAEELDRYIRSRQ